MLGASDRRRSGRISSSATKSRYVDADSDEDDDATDSAAPKPVNVSGRKRGRPAKNALPPSASRSKKAKLASDDDGDDYAAEESDAQPEEGDEEDGDDDDDDDDAPPRVTITPLAKLRDTGAVPYEDDRLHNNTLLFLKDLKANNKRAWLKSNDQEFRRAQADWKTYVETLTHTIIAADATIPELPAKDVIGRIYRDIRFSNDPTPYRPYFSAAFSRTGRKGPYACYYVHCEPGGAAGSFVGGGLYMPDAAALVRLRASIDRRPERWRAVLGNEALRATFFGGVKKGDVEGCVRAFCRSNKENALKTKPRAFQADHPNIELLKLRNFTLTRKSLSEDVFTAEEGQQQIGEIVRAMTGFVSFLNDVVMPDPGADSQSSSDEEDEEGEEDEAEAES